MGAQWPASLYYCASSRPMGDLASKQNDESTGEPHLPKVCRGLLTYEHKDFFLKGVSNFITYTFRALRWFLSVV